MGHVVPLFILVRHTRKDVIGMGQGTVVLFAVLARIAKLVESAAAAAALGARACVCVVILFSKLIFGNGVAVAVISVAGLVSRGRPSRTADERKSKGGVRERGNSSDTVATRGRSGRPRSTAERKLLK